MLTHLRNGLTVLVEENRAAPVVALQVWVRVGSADERQGELGIAHLHEHMLFKGTQRRGPGEVARAVEASGGEINAWTSFDQTVYHCTLSSRDWRTGLDVLADAVTSAAFDPAELQREIEVVCEEIKRSLDSPSRKVSQALFAAVYAQHPYGRPVIGSEASVRSHSREGILRFYRRWYQPENIVLVAVGDLTAAELVAEAERRFSWPAQVGVPALEAPPSFLPSPRRTEEPRRYAPKAVLLREPVKEGQLQLAWPAPSLRHDDVAALDAAALVLSHGDASRLHKVLKRDTLLVTGVSASCYTPRDPGVTVVGMTLPAANVPAAIRAATREVHRLRTEEITDEELELACRLLESDAVYQRETVQGQARKLGFYQSGAGGLEFEERYLTTLAALTPALVREAAERWLDPRALVAAAVLPPATASESLDEAGLQALLDEACAAALRESAPPLKPQLSRPPPVRHAVRVGSGKAGEVVRTELPGGGVLLVREEKQVPLVSLRAVWEGGLRAESLETGGAHLLLSRLVSKGTRTRTAEQIARASEAMCGSLGGLAGRNSFGVRAEALSRHFDAAFDLFAEAVAEPAFAPAEVEREKALQLDELHTREDSPQSLAFQLFSQTLYQQHPYRLDVLGTEESLARLGPEQLSALRRARYGPAGAVLAVVGDVDAAEVERKVRARLASVADLATGSARRARLATPVEPPVTAPRLAVRALDKAQAHLVLGFPGTTLASPDKPALDVLAAVLSGQGGRLFVELRDKKSLAYSVTGFSMEGVDPGSFALYIGCSPAKLSEALASLRAELDELRQAAPTAAELDRARTRLAGGHDIGLQRNSARASLLAFDECYHFPLGHGLRYPERIAAVTAEDVLAVARKILRPEAEVIALVAPAASIPAELAARLPSAHAA